MSTSSLHLTSSVLFSPTCSTSSLIIWFPPDFNTFLPYLDGHLPIRVLSTHILISLCLIRKSSAYGPSTQQFSNNLSAPLVIAVISCFLTMDIHLNPTRFSLKPVFMHLGIPTYKLMLLLALLALLGIISAVGPVQQLNRGTVFLTTCGYSIAQHPPTLSNTAHTLIHRLVSTLCQIMSLYCAVWWSTWICVRTEFAPTTIKHSSTHIQL